MSDQIAPTGPSPASRRLLAALGATAVLPLAVVPLAPASADDTALQESAPSQAADPTAGAEAAGGTGADTAPTQPEPQAPVPEPPAPEPPAPEIQAPAPETIDAAPAPAAAPVPAETPAGATGEAPVPAGETAAATGPDVTANLSSAPASGWYRSRQPIRFVAADVGGGVRSITVVVDGTQTERAGGDVTLYIEGNGVHAVEYWATDLDGRTGARKSLSMAIDGLAPRIATGDHRVIEQGSQVQLGHDCRDEHSGMQSCDAEGLVDGFLPSAVLGEQSVAIHALDRAGNEASELFTYTVVEAQAQPPRLQLNIEPAPASGWYRGPVDIIVSATASDPADRIESVHWAFSGAQTGNGSSAGENGAAFTVGADGVTRVAYSATTAKGGFAEGEATVRIDSVRPEILFTAPNPSRPGELVTVALGDSEQLAFECSDAHSGVDFCGEELPLLATGGVLPLDTSSLGRKSIVIESADVAGNRSKAAFDYEVVAVDPGDPGDSGGDSDGNPDGDSGAEGPGKPGDGSAGASGGRPSTQPTANPGGPGTAAGTRLAHTGSSWMPPAAIGTALALVAGSLALVESRRRRR